jgi:hypothetical protein
LADKRRRRRFRDRGIDPLLFRVFLSLVGAFSLVAAGLGISREASGLDWVDWALVALLVLFGGGMLYVSLFSSDQNVDKWSDAASRHEVAVLVFIVALPVAWAIRKVFPRDAT